MTIEQQQVQPTLAAPPARDDWPLAYDIAFREGAEAMREAAAKVCEDEKGIEDTGDESDAAYNRACDHCALAVRNLPLEPPK
jgi:hypothetical protein